MILSAQIAGLIAFILIAVLLGNYQGGFGWGVSFVRRENKPPIDFLFHSSLI